MKKTMMKTIEVRGKMGHPAAGGIKSPDELLANPTICCPRTFGNKNFVGDTLDGCRNAN